MKREILLLFSTAMLALGGCATYDDEQGATAADYETNRGDSDISQPQPPPWPILPHWENRAPGDYHP